MLQLLLLVVVVFQPLQTQGDRSPSAPPLSQEQTLSFTPPIDQGLEVTTASGTSTTAMLTITNTGTSPVEFAFPHYAGDRGLGGPDAFGYSWIDSDEPHGPVFDEIDIRDSGTEITPLLPSPGCDYSAPDEGYQVVDLPFDFSFYGEAHNQVWVSANGFLTFEPHVFQVQCSFSINDIPSTSLPRYFIAPLWADLHGYAQGRIYVEHLADGQERVLRFESQLDVGSFFIDDVSLQAWVPIISMEPRSGTVAPGETADLVFTADTEGIEPGTYLFDAVIQTNAPDSPELVLPVSVVVTPVDSDDGATLLTTSIDQNHPNPFTRTTTIAFAVAESGRVLIAVYDAAGRRVATLVDATLEAGAHSTNWDAGGLASGVYFYRIHTSDSVQTMRALIVR